ncbi:uncharacterized protein BXZ73DRAFT_50076 [Epithele typhae]|uniref:uncharacterized protein n=1 Tax=Epithele typhae TaxID=378194 RepID=UPI002007A194|nr:uncharacterized protein BXZ73DRAFT_50076 [Epithele typhae]KAH9925404.1 hypothetical protein BXZ73DRAFT_50076 [Epithele typhae]
MLLVLAHLFAFLTLCATALGQRISIGAPAEWSTVSPGSNLTVRVDLPLTLTGTQEVAIAIGFWPCAHRCADQDVREVLGDVVYRGLYTPALVTPGLPPFENVTVAVPEHLEGEEVSLNVAHFSLIGAGAEPFMEVANITLFLAEVVDREMY